MVVVYFGSVARLRPFPAYLCRRSQVFVIRRKLARRFCGATKFSFAAGMEPGKEESAHFIEFYKAFNENAGAAVDGKKAKSASNVTTPQWLAAFTYLDKVHCERGSFAKVQRVLHGCNLDVLKRRYNGRDSGVARPGPPPTLGVDFEDAVTEYCLESARNHCSQTVSALLSNIGKMKAALASKYPHLETVTLGRKWLQLFLRRHPELGRRKAELLETPRVSAVNRGAIARYFQLAQLALSLNPGKPVYCMDEMNIDTAKLEAGVDDYIGEVGKPCYTPTATTGGHVSFAGLIKYGHAGFLLPTLIFAGVRPLDRLVPDDMRLMMTKSGYMEDFSFISWVQMVLASDLEAGTLFMDNHYSHQDPESLGLLKAAGWTVVFFHPHTTHKVCPLDVGAFGPLKKALMGIVGKRRSDGKPPTRYDVGAIVKESIELAIKPKFDVDTGLPVDVITSGFKRSGIVRGEDGVMTVNPGVITDADYLPADRLMSRRDALEAELAAKEGRPIVAKPAQLKLSEEDLAVLKADILAPAQLNVAALGAHYKAKPRKGQVAEIGTGLYFMERLLAVSTGKAKVAAEKLARKEAKAAAKAAKPAKAAGGKKRKRQEEEEEEADGEGDDAEGSEDEDGDDDDEEEEEEAPYEIAEVREQRMKGKKLELRVKYGHLSEEANKAYEWQPAKNFSASNPAVVVYFKGPMPATMAKHFG